MKLAGGVGGLVVEWCYRVSGGTTSREGYAPCYDGNGNVMALVSLSLGEVVGQYEYGAFGETISVEGDWVAQENPVRFSTKYGDAETRLVYDTHRYYEAATGRWLIRDPIEERGGINLYGMVGNDTLNYVDLLGLCTIHLLFRGDGTGDDPSGSVAQQLQGLEQMLAKCPSVLGVCSWDVPTVQPHYPKSGTPALPKGDYDQASRISSAQQTNNSNVSNWLSPQEHGQIQDGFERDLDNEVGKNYPIGADNWVPVVPAGVHFARIIVTGGGRATWAPSQNEGALSKSSAFHLSRVPPRPGDGVPWRPFTGDIYLRTGVDKYVLAHELGHFIGWTANGSTHSLDTKNLTSWYTGVPTPDCQWCNKIVKIAK